MSETISESAAAYLEANADALVSEWIDWVRERVQTTTVTALPERALRNHVPPVLKSLARYIRSPAELARQELLNHLRLHGHIRRDQGYTLKEVLAEFDGLAEIVTERINEAVDDSAKAADASEALLMSTRLARGLRSVSYIAMGTYDETDEQRYQAMSARLEDFARTVAHELRGPLVTLNLGLEGLRDFLEDAHDDTNAHVEAMKAAVVRSSTLIDSLMMLAIAERARAGTHLVPVDEAIDAILKEFAQKASAVQVELQSVEPMPELEVERVVVDTVLANLIGNAVKYSDPEKEERWVKVTARFIEEEHDSGFCEIQVEDNGLGIPQELAPRVFQRSFRAHPANAVGTGLGLHIAQQILTERGGTLTLESTEGEGTTVTARMWCLAGNASALSADSFRVDQLMGEAALEDPPVRSPDG